MRAHLLASSPLPPCQHGHLCLRGGHLCLHGPASGQEDLEGRYFRANSFQRLLAINPIASTTGTATMETPQREGRRTLPETTDRLLFRVKRTLPSEQVRRGESSQCATREAQIAPENESMQEVAKTCKESHTGRHTDKIAAISGVRRAHSHSHCIRSTSVSNPARLEYQMSKCNGPTGSAGLPLPQGESTSPTEGLVHLACEGPRPAELWLMEFDCSRPFRCG
jgi:hypothetical protein